MGLSLRVEYEVERHLKAFEQISSAPIPHKLHMQQFEGEYTASPAHTHTLITAVSELESPMQTVPLERIHILLLI